MLETGKYVLIDKLNEDIDVFISEDYESILEIAKQLLLSSNDDEDANRTEEEVIDLYYDFKKNGVIEIPDIDRKNYFKEICRLVRKN